VSNFIYIFVPLLAAAFFGWGSSMLGSASMRRLKIARVAFCLALLCLFLVAIWISATIPNGFFPMLAGSLASGGIIGVLAYVMWVGIDNEIVELNTTKDGK
jgi:hypothetical protein